jgi:hypothetical protein
MTDYLTMAEVLAMHAQIERYGGSPGVRDYSQPRGPCETDGLTTWRRVKSLVRCSERTTQFSRRLAESRERAVRRTT